MDRQAPLVIIHTIRIYVHCSSPLLGPGDRTNISQKKKERKTPDQKHELEGEGKGRNRMYAASRKDRIYISNRLDNIQKHVPD